MDITHFTSVRRMSAIRCQRSQRVLAAGIAVLLLGQQAVYAACPVEEVEILVGSEGFPSDEFGQGVDIRGDYAVVGGEDHVAGTEAGAAYFFQRIGDSWVEMHKVIGSDTDGSDRFGGAVAMSGDTAVIAARAWNNSGAVYVFVRSGDQWIEQAKLLAPDIEPGDLFGQSVAIDGDTIIVGSTQSDSPGAVNGGAAYIFVRNGTTWSHQQRLIASDVAAFQSFGISVAISGDTALIGNSDDNHAGNDSGAAYVFQRTGTNWSQLQKLVAPDAQAQDFFGEGLAISDDCLMIGASRDDQACPTNANCNSGSAYVFTRTGGVWAFDQLLTASDQASNDFFGLTIAMSGNIAVIGAPLDGPAAGSAYVFARIGGSWTEQAQIQASDTLLNTRFGTSVGTDGESAIAGAVRMNQSHLGEAYVFDLNCAAAFADLTGDGVVDGADLANLLSNWGACPGCPADLNGDGVVNGADMAQLLANWT